MNGDAYVAATLPPQVRMGKRTYTGRVLSLEQIAPFIPYSEQAAKGALTVSELAAFARVFLMTVFPRPWWMVWRKAHPAVDAMCAQPWPVLAQAVTDFFVAQAAMLAPPTPRTSGGTSTGAAPAEATTPSP